MSVKVSVIMPSLNAAAYIKKSLTSVLQQSLSELEILCIDAGSTDGTLEILQEYASADSRIRIIHSDIKSYGYQVNLGIRLACGEYVGIVETDDYIESDMYESLYYKAVQHNLDIIRANVYYFLTFEGNERRIWHSRNYMDGNYYNKPIDLQSFPKAMLYADFINIWDGIYRRDFLIDKHLQLHESPGASYQDAGFSILCSVEAERIMFDSDYYYCYRFDNEDSSVKSQVKYKCTLSEFQWIREELKRRGKTQAKYQALYMYFLFNAYFWNLCRLTREYRKAFLAETPADFIYDFDESILDYRIPYKDFTLQCYNGKTSLAAPNDISKIAAKKAMNRLQEILITNEPVVFMTVNPHWVQIIETIMFLKPNTVWAICDNSPRRHQSLFQGKIVGSVKDTVKNYPTGYYILPEKTYADDLAKQLESLGISASQIDHTLHSLKDMLANIDLLTNRLHVDEEDLTP